jgi:hypothetical protein
MQFGPETNRFKLMKKNDILRVRVDVATFTALQRACADSGCSLSHILRESIVRELARRNGKSDAHPTHAHSLNLGTELEAIRIESEAIQPSQTSPSSIGMRHLAQARNP